MIPFKHKKINLSHVLFLVIYLRIKEFNPTDLQINLLEIERVFLEVEIRESNSILDALT